MGHITRLNTVFANKNLPAIVDRDITAIESTILKYPNLQGFWDFGDTKSLTLSGNRITRVADKSKNNNPIIAVENTAPTSDALTLKGVQSGYFDGNKFMSSENIVFRSTWAETTMVVFAQKPIKTESPANTILTSRKKISSYAVYTDNSSIACNAGRARVVKNNIVGKPLNIIASTVFATNESHLRTPNDYSTSVVPNLTADNDHLYIGRWSDGADEAISRKWHGYVGHVMVFDKNLEKDPIFMDLLFEYARRKYGTPSWE